MGQRYLLDTNTIIDFAAGRLPLASHLKLAEIIDSNASISVINKIELLSFSNVPKEILAFTEIADILPLSDEVITETISIRKEYKLKLPDAIIAATAVVFDLVILTRNISDFKKVVKLNIVDPHSLN